ncbi:MAG: hypothetical protein Q8N17_15410, partial [Burkholderiaceae bacterium]|nr:hypothetical protein [Burkholderiaceae bacterium]
WTAGVADTVWAAVVGATLFDSSVDWTGASDIGSCAPDSTCTSGKGGDVAGVGMGFETAALSRLKRAATA